MRRTYRYDPELDAMIEITNSNHPDDEPSGLQIMKDIDPYRTVGSDIASGNQQIVIGSRTRHRQFLRDNGYEELGNDTPVMRSMPETPGLLEDLRRAAGMDGSNTGADEIRYRQENRRRMWRD